MSESSTRRVQVNAILSAKNLCISRNRWWYTEAQSSSDSCSSHEEPPNRRTMSLNEMELQNRLQQPFALGVPSASPELRNSENNLELTAHEQRFAEYKKCLKIMYMLIGCIVFILISLMCYLFTRKNVEVMPVILPSNSSDSVVSNVTSM